MAILNRGGLEADLDKSKMLPRETVVTTDTKKVFTAFAPGEVEQMATIKEMNEAITEVTADIIADVTQDINTTIENAETATANANTAVSDVNGALITANGIIDTVTQNNTDMEVAEGNRVTAEETRESNEDTRKSNEIDRQEFYTAYQVCESYDNVKPYVVGNKVVYNGSTYQCIADCTDILPTNTINWICIAEKGLDGTGTGDMTASTYDPQGKATDIFAYVGDKTTLATSNKADLVSAINETFQSVSEGIDLTNYYTKTDVDNAIDEVSSQLADLSSQELNKGASLIGIHDANELFTATSVEGAMQELFTNVSSGKSLVGGAITGVDDTVVIPTDPTFQNLADAIGQISSGKKWASGNFTADTLGFASAFDIGFEPSIIVVTFRNLKNRNGLYLYIKESLLFPGSLSKNLGATNNTTGVFSNISSGGFTLKVDDIDKSEVGNWIAYE